MAKARAGRAMLAGTSLPMPSPRTLALPGRMAWRCCRRNALRADAWFVPELRLGRGRNRDAETWASADILSQASRVEYWFASHAIYDDSQTDGYNASQGTSLPRTSDASCIDVSNELNLYTSIPCTRRLHPEAVAGSIYGELYGHH